MSSHYIQDFVPVILTFFFISFVWPKMVFWKYLKGKRVLHQFALCLCGSFVLYNVAALILGSLSILNQAFYAVLFWGAFIGTMGWRIWVFYKEYSFMQEGEVIEIPWVNRFFQWWAGFKEKFQNRKKDRFGYWFDIALNIIVIVLIFVLVWHMGEQIRMRGAYIFSDTERHEGFIKSMIANDLFKDGVYPFGLHSFMYTATTALGCNLYNFNMYSGNLMTLVFFVALYYWTRKVLKTKTASVAVLALFLIVATTVLHYDPNDRMVYDGLHRLRYSLPEEYCLFGCFIAPTCLIAIMKSKESMKDANNITRLVIMGLSIAVVFATHFYTMIFLIIICVVTFFSYIRFIKKEKFIALAISIASSAIVVLIPFGLGFVKVKKLMFALSWASGLPSGESKVFEELASVVPTTTPEQIQQNPVMARLTSFWNDAIVPLFTQNFVVPILIILGVGLVVFIYVCIRRRDLMYGYLSVIICAVVFMLIYASPALGIPRIMESYRVVIVLYVMLMVMGVFIIDVVLDLSLEIADTTKKVKKVNAKKKKALESSSATQVLNSVLKGQKKKEKVKVKNEAKSKTAAKKTTAKAKNKKPASSRK